MTAPTWMNTGTGWCDCFCITNHPGRVGICTSFASELVDDHHVCQVCADALRNRIVSATGEVT